MLFHRRVLLADDDLEVRSGVAELLAPMGLECVLAESGPEALALAIQRLPELVLMVLDMHMPGCTGIEVLSRLRGQVNDLRVPCIVYSGAATDEIERQALDAGAWAFLHKPVRPERLRGEVQRALEFVQGSAARSRDPRP